MCMLLMLRLANLIAIVYKNIFRRKFNTHVFTGFSICNRVALKLKTVRKSTNFYRIIYYTSLRYLGGWVKSQKESKQ